MMRRVCGVFVFLALFFLQAQTIVAAVYYVDVTGNDASGDGSPGKPWRTLKFAASRVAANQGHIIKLSAGTFVEAGLIDIPAGVSIEGAGKDVTILKANSSFYYNPATPGYSNDKFLLRLNESAMTSGNQHLQGFTIDGDGKKLHGGIFVNNRSYVVVDGVKITGTNFTGMWLWGTKNSHITNTDLVNCSWGSAAYSVGALNLGNLDQVEIDHCYIDENVGYGIKAIGPSGAITVSNTKIHDCTVTVTPNGLWNNGSAPNIAIETYLVDPFAFEIYNCYIDNTISLVSDRKTPLSNQGIRVHHNTLDMGARANGSGYAIELTMHNAEIDHNYINRGSYGIANWAGPMQNWSIHHNIFYAIQNSYPGEVVRSQISGVHNVVFVNNTIEFDGTRTASVFGLYGGSSDNVTVKNNLFINSSTSYSYYADQFIHLESNATVTGLTVTNNLFFKLPIGNVTGTYSNNLTSDPLITKNGARPDPYYYPATGSPLIDAGVNVGFPFSGSAPDIGAFESGNASTNTPPTVSITSPANNASFTTGNSVTINANASDTDGSIAKVEFFNGSTKLGEDLASPYSFTWSNLAAGSYTLSAKATDNKGAVTSSSSITITVKNPNVPPVVSITSPANNASFATGSSVTITAKASDADGSVAKVEFFNGTVKLGEDLASPYSFTWTNLAAGSYAITAKATDNNGAITTSTAITITVNNPNVPPVVSITSPVNNASFTAGSSVTITATASDSDGSITKIEFFNGSTKLGEDLASPYNFVWNNLTAGSYAVTAKATDNNGAITTSTAITITVNNPNVPPVVSITSPVNNASFTAGSSATITANASDSDGSITKVEFFNGSTKLGEALASPYNFVWNNLTAGSYAITAKATDNNGAITTSTAINITINNPNVPPVVNITSPANNASFTAGSAVTITTNASDADGSISKVEFFNGSVKLGEDLSSPYSFVWNNLSAGTYAVTAKATDNNGTITTSTAITITVNNPNVPPVVSITSPVNNASFTAGSSVPITANASDADGSISKVEFFNGSVKLGEDLSSPYSFVWNNLTAGSYAITAKATDNNGAITTSTAINITINNPNVPPVVNITSPANNASFTAGSAVTITANASDADGSISKVEFFNGSVKLGEDLSSPYSFAWNNLSVGNYTINVRATDNLGATATSVTTIIVTKENHLPTAHAGSDITITLPDDSATLQGSGDDQDGNIVAYEWKQLSGPGNAIINPSNTSDANVSGLVAGTYYFQLTVTDNQGASADDRMSILVKDAPKDAGYRIPKFFSPNADGINDYWEWQNADALHQPPVIVFNRFGQKVFESESYQNNWDGKYNGKALEEDAYYYVIRTETQTLNGAVRIIK